MTWPTVTRKLPLNNPSIVSAEQTPLNEFKNVHDDDIHALISLGNGTFASGSKDTTIKLWDRDWKEITTLNHPRLNTQNSYYCHWITALTLFEDGNFASGTRDGSIAIWSPNGDLHSWRQKKHPGKHVCKDRNVYRINCLQQLPVKSNQHLFLAGLPASLSTFKWTWNNHINEVVHTPVHKNDWVYCIKQIKADDFFVAIGSHLQIWSKSDDDYGILHNWKKKENIITEDPKDVIHHQRPLISSMEYIAAHKIALACFTGHVKIVDFEHDVSINTKKIHQGRVWTIAKTSDIIFASGADDHKALLWDIRQKNPASVIGMHPGRVSCLLFTDDKTLVAASCPDDLNKAKERGSFTVWDLRKLHTSTEKDAD